jgi:hypothetical protein
MPRVLRRGGWRRTIITWGNAIMCDGGGDEYNNACATDGQSGCDMRHTRKKRFSRTGIGGDMRAPLHPSTEANFHHHHACPEGPSGRDSPKTRRREGGIFLGVVHTELDRSSVLLQTESFPGRLWLVGRSFLPRQSSLEIDAFLSGRRRATTDREIGPSARMHFIWIHIKPLNRKLRLLS